MQKWIQIKSAYECFISLIKFTHPTVQLYQQSLRFIAVGHKQHLPIDNIFCSTTPNFSFHTFCGNCRIFAIRQVVINTLVLVRFVQKCWRRHSYTLYTVVPSAIIPCEEVIDRIISCIALTLDIEVIDINISKHVSAPNDACDKQWPN